VRHSKVRSSKPRVPGEILANPILWLQGDTLAAQQWKMKYA
jgi:hypothetical protein